MKTSILLKKSLIFIGIFIISNLCNAQNQSTNRPDTLYNIDGLTTIQYNGDSAKKKNEKISYNFSVTKKEESKSFWQFLLDYGILISLGGTIFTIYYGIKTFKINEKWKEKEFNWKETEFTSKQKEFNKNIEWKNNELIWKEKEFNWKRAEFLSNEMNIFLNDFNVKRATIMLDWNEFPISYTETEKITFNTTSNYFAFSDELFGMALIHHSEQKRDFTSSESVIRLVIDDFLLRLTMFEHYIDRGIIEFEDLKPYLRYTADLIGNVHPDLKRKDVKVLQQLWNYIIIYDNKEVVNLLKRYGYNIEVEIKKIP